MAGWLTQTPAARRLNVTPKRLEQLVKDGQLVAATDFYGRRRYDPAPIELLRARVQAGFTQTAKAPAAGGAAGKAQARAFKMFAAGKQQREVVIETELAPAMVLELRRQYAAMGGDLLITAPVLEDVRDVLDWRGEATERGFLWALRARIRRAFAEGSTVSTGAAAPPNHTNDGGTSGNIDTGTAGEGNGSDAAGEGSVPRDPRGETG
jgi:hypothetical protein